METNQKVICKRYYPGSEMGLEIQYQYFLTGNTYTIINKVWSNDKFYYMIVNEALKPDPFDENELKEYFHTIAEIRKNKLLKLKKSINNSEK